jgi:hypothetical protein
MALKMLANIASSKGDKCTVVVSEVEWQLLRIYGQIENVTEDADKACVIEAPLSHTPKPAGFEYGEMTNNQGWKNLKIIFHERVTVFGDDEELSISAKPSMSKLVRVCRAPSATKSIKDSVHIEE